MKKYIFAASLGVSLALYRNREQTLVYIHSITNKDQALEQNLVLQDVKDYIQLKSQSNKLILYSHLHKCPLSVHQLINKQTIQLQKESKSKISQLQISKNDQTKDQKIQQLSDTKIQEKTDSVLSSSTTSTNSSKTTITTQSQVEENSSKMSKTQALYNRFFNSYAKNLIEKRTCESVELISGPIYSKDTPYKQKSKNGEKQYVDNIYTTNIRISEKGEYLTDRFYTIVVCNRNKKQFLNGFTMRRSYGHPTFRLTNYLTAMKKIEEQTGLLFNVKGQPLTTIDFQGINKQRTYSQFEEVIPPNNEQP